MSNKIHYQTVSTPYIAYVNIPEPYEYQPLSKPTSIRLLYSCSQPDQSNTPSQEPTELGIQQYLIREADLELKPEFEALSYTWQYDSYVETTRPSEQITVDGQALWVTSNLADALRRLAVLKRPTPIWIDAVCINQTDVMERSNQVNMMGRIYSTALTVIVWIGPTSSANDGTTVPDTLTKPERILQRMNTFPQLERFSSEVGIDLSRAAEALKQAKFSVRMSELHAVLDIFRYGWFSRAWTIQEVTLANEVTVYFGETEIPWKILHNTALMAGALVQYTQRLFSEAIQRQLNAGRLHVMMRMYFQAEVKQPLDSFLDMARSHNATDARDKVFSLLGLINHEPGLEPLRADYSLSVEAVYQSCAEYILRGRAGLRLLSTIEGKSKQEMDELPSWAPNLTVFPKAIRLKTSTVPKYPAKQSLEIVGRSLLLDGSCFATVDAVAEDIDDIDWELRPLEFLRILGSLEATYCTGERTFDAIRKTLTAPVIGVDGFPAERLKSTFPHWLVWYMINSIQWTELGLEEGHHLKYFLTGGNHRKRKDRCTLPDSMAKHLRDAVRQLGHVFADDIDIEEIMTTIEDTLKASWKTVDDEDTAEHKDISLELRQPSVSFDKAYYWSYKGLVLFRAKENLIGLSPQSTLPGDQVFMLRNAHVPFILRPVSSGAYELVGEAYVHGLMEGQAMHEVTGKMSRIKIV